MQNNPKKRIILSGCNGKMGRVISSLVADRSDCEIILGIDINTAENYGYPVKPSVSDLDISADAVIDFSNPNAVAPLLRWCIRKKVPAVIATTGLRDSELELIRDASDSIPIFFTANMSLGVNLIIELARKAAAVLAGNFDIEIVEKHHNQKIDAPSGTALMIADSVNEVLGNNYQYTFDRHSQLKKREKNEIGIHAVRGGTIVGEHEIIFAGRDEIVTISHSAQSKEIFAVGAVNAALFIIGKKPGIYNMNDLVLSKK